MRRLFACRATTFFLAALFIWSGGLSYGEDPIENVRFPKTDFSFVYFPSFGILQSNAPLPFHDNFFLTASFLNLIPVGPNLNIIGNFLHQTQDLPVFPITGEWTNQKLKLNKDQATGTIGFAFFNFFQFKGTFDYLQSRTVLKTADSLDFDYNRVRGALDFTFDQRYSSLQTWVSGTNFIYPESGFQSTIGVSSNLGMNNSSGSNLLYYTIYGNLQQLFKVADIATLSVRAQGESALGSSLQRAYKIASKVIGAYQYAGDFAADTSVELRMLWPQGFYWDTPEFSYVNTFAVKFSPGVILGYNFGMVGEQSGLIQFMQSAYLSPLVAVRLDGSLSAVLRMDISIATSSLSKLVIGIGYGNVNENPTTILKSKIF